MTETQTEEEAPAKISLLRFKVWLRDPQTGAEQKPFTVPLTNGAVVKWEREQARNSWPSRYDAPNMFGAYVCYLEARRAGNIDAKMPFDVFTDNLLQVEEDRVDVDPTLAEPGTG